MEQKIFRKNDVQILSKLINQFDQSKIFVVRDKKSYHVSGAESFIEKLVNRSKLNSFYDFEPNPQLDDLKKGINKFNEDKFELIIAIGGGSVLDMAKLISIFVHQNSNIESIVLGKVKLKKLKTPLIAIPTTAGTGAEATQFAVLYIDKKKFSVNHPAIRPDYVYLSSEFSLSANPYLTACTGLDAFCQAVESIWSVNANNESLKYALEASRLSWNNLYKAVKENSETAKTEMQEASFLAGKAINITTTTAPHALSYAFTSYYGIPHGHAVTLSLPFFLEYNYGVSDSDCTDKRGAEKVKERIDQILEVLNLNRENMQNTITKFFHSIGISIEIPNLIKNFDPEIIINNVNIERLSNNPRIVSKEVISRFLANQLK